MTDSQEEVRAEVRRALIGAWYPLVLSSPYAAAGRAQGAFTSCTAILTGLLAVGILADIATRPLLVQLIGAAAALLWATSALLFLKTSTISPELEQGGETAVDPESFQRETLESARTDAARVSKQTRRAVVSASAAAAATLTAFVIGGLIRDSEQVTIWFEDDSDDTVMSACDQTQPFLTGDVLTEELTNDAPLLKIEPSDCPQIESLMINRDDVAAITVVGG
ncbi:MAG: hypothetical protein M3285_03180 [Actinomycetota bacterium]|nr:hypothetical protein [Actinomycetota bacterium]MDQ3954535.1 hypothetical protein [Actinomycetota bacterium]